MDYLDQNKTWELSNKLLEFSEKYADHRKVSADNKTKFDIILASKFNSFRQQKPNLGHETAVFMLLESGDKEVETYYTDWQFNEAQYKGLEKIIEAIQSKISLSQSIMKNMKTQGAGNG